MSGENMRIYSAVERTPDTAKKPILGGRMKGMTDINPMYRIKTLTERFGPCGVGWYTDILDRRTVECPSGEVMCFMDINLYYREDPAGEWSEPVFGTGGNALVAREKSGLYANDEGWKMAYTDALSVACKALGICADVYYEKDYGKYTAPERQQGGDAQPQGGRKGPESAQHGSGQAGSASARQGSALHAQSRQGAQPGSGRFCGSSASEQQGNAPQQGAPQAKAAPVMATVQQIQFIRDFASDSLYQSAMESFGAELERMTYNQGQKMIARINEEARKNENV